MFILSRSSPKKKLNPSNIKYMFCFCCQHEYVWHESQRGQVYTVAITSGGAQQEFNLFDYDQKCDRKKFSRMLLSFVVFSYIAHLKGQN